MQPVRGGDVQGKAAVIVDDLISAGGSLVRGAEACRRGAPTMVFAAAAHGLSVDGATHLFETPAIDAIAVLNAVPPLRVVAEAGQRRLTVRMPGRRSVGPSRHATMAAAARSMHTMAEGSWS